MNTFKSNGLMRPIAFIMVGILLVSTFGFTADGWQIGDSDSNQVTGTDETPPSVELPTEELPNENEESEIIVPRYINYLTGLETTEELHNAKPISVLMNSNSATYGIFNADVLCEMPVEDNTTRLLAIISDTKGLWKIGSISGGRGYISNISKFFGATFISDKNEDNVAYDHCDMSGEALDISMHNGSFYTEYSHYNYTSCEMLERIFDENLLDSTQCPKAPYVFSDIGSEAITGEMTAEKISINYTAISTTELIYNAESAEYLLHKNGCEKSDAMNGKTPTFTNCFVLFADSATYDNSEGTRLVINTIGGGVGYYFTNGTVIEIKWTSSLDGSFSFFLPDGTPLTVNRGRCYIGFVKTSAKGSVSF